MPGFIRAGDVLADRYRLEDLLAETGDAMFWRAHDSVLHRPVAVQIIRRDDARLDEVLAAARSVGPLTDRRLLRVLDADHTERICFVVVEWGQGESLDLLLDREGPLSPRKAAWVVAEVADTIAGAHDAGLAHGRLVPENVLIDHHGQVRVIGFGIEAALAGLPPGRILADVTDLAGVLYAALTGTWPGVSRSRVRTAPLEHGHVLRPRRVRAGIPRPLDSLCDEVLNDAPPRGPRGPYDLTTARGISDMLSEFVGDATGMIPSGIPPVGLTPVAPTPIGEPPLTHAAPPEPAPEVEPQVEPQVEAESEAGSGAGSEDPGDAATANVPAPTPPPPAADLPTEAGMPVFHDDSADVEWLRARSEPPAPPPPLEEIKAKPLFAPDPPKGQPVRRPRAGTPAAEAAAANESFWPWEESTSAPAFTDSTTGGWRHDTFGTDPTGERVPGRSWLQLAMLIALGTIVLLASVAAYQWGRGGDDSPPPADRTSSQSAERSASAFPIEGATDFDPQGAPPQDEYPDLVPLAIDGDVDTVWHTAAYKQNFGPEGLKDGVGILVDLGDVGGVREVMVTVRGTTSLSIFVTEESPTGVADLTPAGTASGNGEVTVRFDEAVSGRYVTVWLTSIPRSGEDFRGEIAEIQVRG